MKFRELLLKKEKELRAKIEASTDATEVRELGETLKAVLEELRALEEAGAGEGAGEGEGTGEEASRSTIPEGAVLRNAHVVGSFGMSQQRSNEDPTDSVEYRTAFMNYVCRNVPIPAELRADAITTTTDAGAVIPTTYLNEIIQKMETYGNVYALVRKLNVQGGIAIPILSLKPEATWIGETTPSESKKLQANTTITFSYFGVECKLAQTLLANVTTLEQFQKLFVPLATEAIVKAVEIAIFKGNGTTQPLGITVDTRVPAGNVITLAPEEITSWSAWHKKVKAKMKKAYRNGTFFMNQATFDGYIDGMEDEHGQPVGRVNYGINGEETYRFMGKAVETVEDECIEFYDDAAEGDVIAIFMKPTDYAVNTNLQMTTVKWVDHDTNEVKTKCILIIDGKLVDADGVLIIKKGVVSA